MKILVILAALATLIAAPAFAQSTRQPLTPAMPNAAYANTHSQHVVRNPNDIISGDRVIGRDPDPFIGNEIRRHYETGWPD